MARFAILAIYTNFMKHHQNPSLIGVYSWMCYIDYRYQDLYVLFKVEAPSSEC
ncbi:MAG: hypothetical protein ACTSRK_14910 [Promethearchaeota archaeon]